MTQHQQDNRPRRSALYLPASNARAIEKARLADCDVVILDLEDAVAPEQKADARAQAVAAVAAGGFGHRELVVRVNGLDTPWGADDLSALLSVVPDAVLTPKVSSPEQVAAYEAALAAMPPSVGLWVMVETCASLFQLDAIGACAARGRLRAMVMGLNDLAKEMRAPLSLDRKAFHAAMSLAVAAARAHGLAILDGVLNLIDDDAALEAACLEGVAFGFDGKTLIHPAQIATANRVFAPSDAACVQAQAIVDAFSLPENAGKGAIRVNGRMTERLHLSEAARLLAQAAAIAARHG